MKSLAFRRILSAILAISFCLSLAACNYDEPINIGGEDFYLAKNDQIDDATQATLDTINTAFTTYLASSNPDAIKPYFGPGFTSSDEQLTKFADAFISKGAAPFTLYDKYYINNVKPESIIKRFKKFEESLESAELTPASSEMYLTLYTSENENISYMISLLCAKTDDSWGIVWIDTTDYKYNGMNAKSIYDKANNSANSGNFLSSYVYSLMFNMILRPANTLVYDLNYLMEDFYYRTMADFQQHYMAPYPPEGVADATIHDITLTNSDEHGLIPLIIMQSNIVLTESDALEEKAQEVIDSLEIDSPEFGEDFPFIAFTAMNDAPSFTNPEPESVSFIIEVE